MFKKFTFALTFLAAFSLVGLTYSNTASAQRVFVGRPYAAYYGPSPYYGYYAPPRAYYQPNYYYAPRAYNAYYSPYAGPYVRSYYAPGYSTGYYYSSPGVSVDVGY